MGSKQDAIQDWSTFTRGLAQNDRASSFAQCWKTMDGRERVETSFAVAQKHELVAFGNTLRNILPDEVCIDIDRASNMTPANDGVKAGSLERRKRFHEVPVHPLSEKPSHENKAGELERR